MTLDTEDRLDKIKVVDALREMSRAAIAAACRAENEDVYRHYVGLHALVSLAIRQRGDA